MGVSVVLEGEKMCDRTLMSRYVPTPFPTLPRIQFQPFRDFQAHYREILALRRAVLTFKMNMVLCNGELWLVWGIWA